MLTIKREPPSQRRHFRLTSPAVAAVQNVPYRTSDWSLGGFRVDNFEGDAQVGDHLAVQFGLNFHEFSVGFQTDVEVVRLDENRSLAVRFLDLKERERELLLHFASSLTTGEMMPVGDTLARIDIPVTPIATTPKASEAAPINAGSLRARRIAYSSFYAVAGTVLGVYLLGLLYWNTFRLDVEYAVVSVPLQSLVSQDLGKVQELFVPEGAVVQAGQPVLRVVDDVLSQEVEARRAAVGKAQAGLRAAELRLRNERDKLGVYKDIARNKLKAAREVVDALTSSKRLAEQQVTRLKTLLEMGAVSAPMVEQAEARLADIQGQLVQAQAELRIGESTQLAVKHGSFYDSRALVGGVPESQASMEEAKDSLRLAREQLRLAEERQARLTYVAPFAGRVVRLLKSPGMVVNRGEAMAVLEPKEATPVVDAFLTQEEIGGVQLGVRASVWIPALDRHWDAQVTRIDRSSGFVSQVTGPAKESETRYNGRGPMDRTATVQLAFQQLPPEEQQLLTGGLPAMVSIPRSPAFLRPVLMMVGAASGESAR